MFIPTILKTLKLGVQIGAAKSYHYHHSSLVQVKLVQFIELNLGSVVALMDTNWHPYPKEQ